MKTLSNRINQILEKKNLSHRKLAIMIEEHDSSVNTMITGKRAFTNAVIQKIAPILEVSPEEIQGWILADKYPKEVLQRAIELKKEKSLNETKLIRTIKMDEVLQSKNLSRTALSKLINYSQGSLNEMIIGKESLSRNVIPKIAEALEISENEIKSWLVADKWTLEVLKSANACK